MFIWEVGSHLILSELHLGEMETFHMNTHKWTNPARWDRVFFNQFFLQMLTLSVLEKLKNSIFKMPIIAQTLKINNLRTTSAKSVNLHTMRKLVKYLLKIIGKVNVCSYCFRDIAFWRSVGILTRPAGHR